MYRIYNGSVVYYKVFCACVVWNGTKEIRKNYVQITPLNPVKPQVYWVFVTKLMGGVNFRLQSMVMRITVAELLAFT